MSKTGAIAAGWFLIASVVGCFTGLLGPRVIRPKSLELSARQTSRMIANITNNFDREIDVLIVASNDDAKRFEAFVNSNHQDTADRLFSPPDSSRARDDEQQLQAFLTSNHLAVDLPAHFVVRKVESAYLIRGDSRRGPWVIRKHEPSGNYSMLGLK